MSMERKGYRGSIDYALCFVSACGSSYSGGIYGRIGPLRYWGRKHSAGAGQRENNREDGKAHGAWVYQRRSGRFKASKSSDQNERHAMQTIDRLTGG